MLVAFAARHYSHDANRFIYQASLSFADPGSKPRQSLARHLLDTFSVFLQDADQLGPVSPSLLQSVRPKFEKQLYTRIIRQNTTRSAQSVKLISLDIHFDEIHAFARLEVVVERYHFDRHRMT